MSPSDDIQPSCGEHEKPLRPSESEKACNLPIEGDEGARLRSSSVEPGGDEYLWALPPDAPLPGDQLPSAETVAEPGIPVVLPLQKPPHPGFWGAVLSCFLYMGVTTGALIAVMGAALLFRIATAPDGKELLRKLQEGKSPPVGEMGMEFGAAFLASELVAVVFAWLIVQVFVGKRWPRLLALRRPSLLHVFFVFLLCPALIYVSTGVHQTAEGMLEKFHLAFHNNDEMQKGFTQWPVWFGVLVVGLGPALNEELFCRGFLGRGLLGRYGTVGGILLTSLFFGILHVDPPHVIATFVMGCCLHFTYLMTRSLWMPMLLHFLNNSAAVVGASLSDAEDKSIGVDRSIDFYVFSAALILGAAVCWALYRSRVRFASKDDQGTRFWQPDYPGAGCPPTDSPYRPIRAWPGWLASSAVLVAAAGFGAAVCMSGGAPP